MWSLEVNFCLCFFSVGHISMWSLSTSQGNVFGVHKDVGIFVEAVVLVTLSSSEYCAGQQQIEGKCVQVGKMWHVVQRVQ